MRLPESILTDEGIGENASFRMTAVMATLGFFPLAMRRS